MRQFLFKLHGPRPTFPQDMTEKERQVIMEHVSYWKGLAEKSVAFVFDPVMDPRGVWGVAIVETVDEGSSCAHAQ